jgi:hypothetical protein
MNCIGHASSKLESSKPNIGHSPNAFVASSQWPNYAAAGPDGVHPGLWLMDLILVKENEKYLCMLSRLCWAYLNGLLFFLLIVW